MKGGFADVAPLAHHMDALDIAYCLAYLSTLVICDERDKRDVEGRDIERLDACACPNCFVMPRT